MVVAEAVAAMAATPAAIEVSLTIVFVFFFSADVSLTRNSEMTAHTSKMDSYRSSIYMNVLPTSLAQTSYHLAPISHLKAAVYNFHPTFIIHIITVLLYLNDASFIGPVYEAHAS